MQYQTFEPHIDLASIVNCYWTLHVPESEAGQKQRIIPDGMIEMTFILGDDIKRYTSEHDFIIQPRAMILGQTPDEFYVEPTGLVESFAVRFYPYGFANFISCPIRGLANKETPINQLFDKQQADELEQAIIAATSTEQRIAIVEAFLFAQLKAQPTLDNLVQSTIEALMASQGSQNISDLLAGDAAKRRQLERKFAKQIGLSPKQLGKVIRLQSALKRLLNNDTESLTDIAYQSDYYDQAHFIKDFKEFTGVNPKDFLASENMRLSSAFYK